MRLNILTASQSQYSRSYISKRLSILKMHYFHGVYSIKFIIEIFCLLFHKDIDTTAKMNFFAHGSLLRTNLVSNPT